MHICCVINCLYHKTSVTPYGNPNERGEINMKEKNKADKTIFKKNNNYLHTIVHTQ